MANRFSLPAFSDGPGRDPRYPSNAAYVMSLTRQDEVGMVPSILLSLAAHISVILLAFAIYYILLFLGWTLMTFQPPERVKDIEFQLVSSPEATPRNPKTRNRAERNTRAGGKKVPNIRESETQLKSGSKQSAGKPQPPAPQKKPVPVPAKPVAVKRPQTQQPSVQPQPRQPVTPKRSYPTPTPPAPPRPRVSAPKPSTSRPHVATVPNPLAPIKTPAAPGPVADTGPVVRGPAAGSGVSGSASSSSGSVGPATLPGQFTTPGHPASGGGNPGQGGRGNYSQYGSPGGGGGRPGIDAVAEPDFGPYIAELQRRIRRNWHPPDDKEDKTVVLLFTVAKDGRLLGITTKRSSGFASADNAARMAIEASAPFRPLPAEFRQNSVRVEFTFDYNVFMGRSGGARAR